MEGSKLCTSIRIGFFFFCKTSLDVSVESIFFTVGWEAVTKAVIPLENGYLGWRLLERGRFFHCAICLQRWRLKRTKAIAWSSHWILKVVSVKIPIKKMPALLQYLQKVLRLVHENGILKRNQNQSLRLKRSKIFLFSFV